MKLSLKAYEHARALIREGQAVLDERDSWSEHQPSPQDENRFLQERGLREFAKWYLGIDEDEAEDSKQRYTFPYGDFEKIHRCGVLSAEVRAAQYKHTDIETAAAHLHGMLDELMAT